MNTLWIHLSSAAYPSHVDPHVLHATTPEGRSIEIGQVGSLEQAARLRAALEAELGDEYVDFRIEEREASVEPALVRLAS